MSSEISILLQDLEGGNRDAASVLMPMVYAELRRLARYYLGREASGQTMQPTALVHEAYLRLVGQEEVSWQGRAHFVALAAIAMRRILVERARRKLTRKRGGGSKNELFDERSLTAPEKPLELLALDEALRALAKLSPRQARVVELRFFAGMTVDEIAQMEGLSERTIKNDWSIARAWLHREMLHIRRVN